jgi:hypothetical protein
MKNLLCFAAPGLTLLLLSACGGDDGDGTVAATGAYVMPVRGVKIPLGVDGAPGMATLEAAVIPWNATNKGVTWHSDDEDEEVVSLEDGVVTALGIGTANVTAISDDGGFVSNACKVEVVPRVPVAALNLWRVTATAANPTAPPAPLPETWSMTVGQTLRVQVRVRSAVDEKLLVGEDGEPMLDEDGEEIWDVVGPDDDEADVDLYDYLASFKDVAAEFNYPAVAAVAQTVVTHPYVYRLTAVSPGEGKLRIRPADGGADRERIVAVTVRPIFE